MFLPNSGQLSGFYISQFDIHRLISYNRSFPSTLRPCCEECASQHQNIKNFREVSNVIKSLFVAVLAVKAEYYTVEALRKYIILSDLSELY